MADLLKGIANKVKPRNNLEQQLTTLNG